MALWCNGIDLTAGTEIDVSDWTEHGLQFTGARSEKNNAKRERKPDLIVVHWTGGEGGHRQVFNTLATRKLGVHLFIDYRGIVYQFADLWTVRCAHAGRANDRSIGIEIQNRGIGKMHPKFPRGSMVMRGHGRKYDGLTMTSDQLDALEEVAGLICASMDIPFKVPTNKEGTGPLLDYLTPQQQRTHKGIAGHIHFSSKVCPGQQVLEELWTTANSLE
jgi:N-acetyl-anhydromuramyl-L-alanine amidase AmpD